MQKMLILNTQSAQKRCFDSTEREHQVIEDIIWSQGDPGRGFVLQEKKAYKIFKF